MKLKSFGPSFALLAKQTRLKRLLDNILALVRLTPRGALVVLCLIFHTARCCAGSRVQTLPSSVDAEPCDGTFGNIL